MEVVGSDHVHLWTKFELALAGGQPVRDCIVCGKLQTWDEALDDREPGMWWNPNIDGLEELSFAEAWRRSLTREGWSCKTHGHLSALGSGRCVMCGSVAALDL